ncbi:MAG TPA: YafY family protein [Nocardioidaceae bacterium]|nr:YafY family protein [Nocardioidaceae bacterium]
MSGARDQVGRLLALVPYIQSRHEVSVEQAAADFGVRPQQIVKDLNVLWFCGLPGLGMGDLIDVDMDALDGEGVIRVSNADYLSRPLRLGSSEASALIVALRALREASDDAVRPIVDRTLAKLEAAAGDGAALAAQVEVRVPANEPELGQLRSTLTSAVDHGRQVRLGYYVPARDEATERTVDPLRVVTAEGNTYLEAWCHLAEGPRLFRLDRVSSAEVLDSPVADHSDVAPRDLSAGLFQPSDEDTLVTLHLEPQARWVAEYYPVESTSELDGGGLRVTLRAGDREWLTRLMLRIGGAARITEPAELSEVVREAAVRALGNYE